MEPVDPSPSADPKPTSRSGAKPPRPPGSRPSLSLVRLALGFYGLLTGIAVLWRGLASGVSILYVDSAAAARGVDWVRDPAAGLLAGLIIIGISREFTRHTEVGERLARVLARTLGPLSWWEIIVLASVSGVAEEAFFRGALQVQVGLFAASLLFGLAHLVPRREWLPWTGFALLAGLLLGWLFAATGNLVAPIITHVLVNAVNLHLLARDYGEEGERGSGQNDSSS